MKKKKHTGELSTFLAYNYTREHILIGSAIMQNYYHCRSKAVEERKDG